MVARSFKSREFRPKQNNKMYLAPPIIYIYIYIWVRLMCALRNTLSHLFLETFFRELKKLSILFQFLRNFFSQMVNYCVSLGHTLAKS